ncbi:MAG: TauD/TfdA family dioxygenase [Candidatus Pelagadaptatus aseana]|uniref:TauD/TfdA dioxygenase family protein n=1 Tax=Candidatus Pelagadaptatus aseana TaxID=3120508 RepID=UPI0039B2904E
MSITVTPSGQACGAEVRGVDLTQPLSEEQITEIKQAWSEHHVLVFPDQDLSDDDLESFTRYFGNLDDDPFFRPIEGRRYIAAIHRYANETTPIFAESWHADWSFKEQPPIGTCLMGVKIPPEGGDTLFANQHLAYKNMPDELKAKIDDLIAIHSAKLAYSPEGLYGNPDPDARSGMKPIISDEAYKTQSHPLVMTHPENGQKAIYGCIGYTLGIEGMSQEDAAELLMELHQWQTSEGNVYRHKWQENMLIMWDNRSVLHAATGGFEGHERLLHRTTIWPQ